nr:DNA cytosine methyltransferase [Gammaproteobacteria bacterium]
MSAKKDIFAVDLFCGAGGLTYGLEAAGIDVRLGVDIDPACEHAIGVNTKAQYLKADVATLDPIILLQVLQQSDVSLLAGCAPCQPFSTYARGAKRTGESRRGRGSRDDWKLVERFGELVDEVQPDLVTMENVPPLAQQPVFDLLLSKLDGYSVDWRLIECRTIGLPQTRKRLVLVASKLGPISIPEFDRERSTVRTTISNLSEILAGGEDSNDRLHRASRLSEINLARIR